ncbi:hypothetical protein G0029_16650 (plasmid) [Acinetobacter sp. YH12138]|uniref:hypothetical protein n=1 Tax=unclassified Acinetobacter TaxID=196816 RepID=UPI0015D2A19D|nr:MULTISPECIES: hypothetical protein [unclassified Acinetobacter]QOW51425.1 hypothetical protein G0029_16650 [Acinetobacter sp. YH12138]
MLEILLSMSKDRPGLFIILVGILFIVVAWVVIISLYIYINIYLKEICKIVYKDEKRFARLMEPFDFFYLSVLPSAYWKEILNIKFNTSFKAFYGNNIYQKIGDYQLKEFLKNYPMFFYLHYLFMLSGILSLIFLFLGYSVDQYFKKN